MSRITGSEAKALMEAYEAVYAPQEITEEQIWEEVENWVNSLLEEGYDLSEYTWEEMYESYLNEMGQRMTTGQATAKPSDFKLTPGAGSAGGSGSGGRRGSGIDRNATQTSSSSGALRVSSSTPQRPSPPAPRQTPPAAPRQTPPTAPRQTSPSVSGPKVKPTQPAAPTKPAGSAMDQWAKANPKLAAAAAEKARIRGTQQTDNPLMKDMKSRLPMNSPSVQSPDVAKLGAGNQSLVNNPNAFKAAPEVKKTAAIAATPKPAPVAPSQNLKQSYEYDAFDLVLEYLIDNGHVETVDEALYVMLEMDAEVINDIVEEVINEDAAYDRNRRRAAQRAQARNEARARGQTGSVPGVGYVTPRRERETYTDSAGVERHTSGARMPKKN